MFRSAHENITVKLVQLIGVYMGFLDGYRGCRSELSHSVLVFCMCVCQGSV